MRHLKGWNSDRPDFRDWKYLGIAVCNDQIEIPPSVDLRPKMSPVEDQGEVGSCVANALCGALEFLELQDLAAKQSSPEVFEPKFDPISRLFVYWNARYLDGTLLSDCGTTIRTATNAIRASGICRESLHPYDARNVYQPPSQEARNEGNNHKVLQSYRLNVSEFEMKHCLAMGYPFVFGMTLYESFEQTGADGLIPSPSGSVLGGHAMLCVGYDEMLKIFIVRNSWGTSWGSQGYCYVPYSMLTNSDIVDDVWTVRRETGETLKRQDFEGA